MYGPVKRIVSKVVSVLSTTLSGIIRHQSFMEVHIFNAFTILSIERERYDLFLVFLFLLFPFRFPDIPSPLIFRLGT